MTLMPDLFGARTPSPVPADVPGDGLPAGAPRGRDAQRILAAETLAELRNLAQTMTVVAERLGGRVVNHVLKVAKVVIPANGELSISVGVAAGCIEVNNTATHTVTVSSTGPTADAAAASGVGLYDVAAGTVRTVAVASRQITLYGTAGDVVSIQVFSAGPVPVVT